MSFCGYLKKDTAVDILLGPFLDDADGDTADTDASIDVELSKNGQPLADSESAAPTPDAAGDVEGYYNCILGTTDTNTLGILTVVAHHADDLPIRQDYQVVTANYFDTMCSTDQFDVNVTNIEGADPTDTIRDAVVDDSTRLDASSLNAIEGKVDTIDGNVDDILTDTGTTLDTLIKDIPTTAEFELRTLLAAEYTVVGDLGTVQSGDSFAIVNGDHGLVSIQDDVDSILADTNELQTDWANGGRLDLILDIIAADTTTDIPALIAALENISKAEVNTEVDTALNTAIPAVPTADSLNDYIQRTKMVVVNKQVITEADGATVIYKDNDADQYCSVAAAYTSVAGSTTKKRLE